MELVNLIWLRNASVNGSGEPMDGCMMFAEKHERMGIGRQKERKSMGC